MKNIDKIPYRGIGLAKAVFASTFLLASSAAIAAENGSTLWPEGAQTVVPAILPLTSIISISPQAVSRTDKARRFLRTSALMFLVMQIGSRIPGR